MARPVTATLLRVSPLGLTEFRQGGQRSGTPVYDAKDQIISQCPQVSSLYEALTWGLIHLRLFEPLAPSALAVRALSRTYHGMSLHGDAAPHGNL